MRAVPTAWRIWPSVESVVMGGTDVCARQTARNPSIANASDLQRTSHGSLHDGDGLNLNQEFGPEQPADHDDRGGRWMRGVDILIPHLAVSEKLGRFHGIHDVVIQLHHIVETRAGRIERGVQVPKHLFQLCAIIALAYEVAREASIATWPEM